MMARTWRRQAEDTAPAVKKKASKSDTKDLLGRVSRARADVREMNQELDRRKGK